MPMKLLSADDFRAAAKAGETPDATVFRFATTEPEALGDEDARTMRFVFSDATVDHACDSIDPKGWDLSVFKLNPVALFSHMSWEPPIGRSPYVGVEGDKLVGDIQFATPDIYPFADTIYQLLKGGFLKAVSVGFKPKEWVFTADKDRPYGIDFKKQILLEISVCPVPCNPNALAEARGAGVDTAPLRAWAEKVLDAGDVVFMPRKALESLRSQASDAAPARYYVQADRDVSSKDMDRMRVAVKRWRDDPNELLVLAPGCTLRAVAEERRGAEEWTCGAARDLPVEADGDWDGAAAQASIFEHAGGDDFNPTVARQGFLAYDASAPELRGSYKLPFAQVVDGELKAMASGIRAAASRLPQADIPDGVKATARAVLDAYEAKLDGKSGAPIVGKAGRRLSAATKSKLQDALDHHEAAMARHTEAAKCIKDVMDADNPAEEPDDDPDDVVDPTPQPPGAVVLDDSMSPEERRLKEARDLKASLRTD